MAKKKKVLKTDMPYIFIRMPKDLKKDLLTVAVMTDQSINSLMIAIVKDFLGRSNLNGKL